MTELLVLFLVLWCVYVSDAVWWTSENSLIVVGSTIGEFRAHCGPSLPVRGDSGFFASTLVPPFRVAFELDLFPPAPAATPGNRRAIEREITTVLALARPLRRLGEGLWVYLFVIAPLAVYTIGLARTWQALLAILVLWVIGIVIVYRRSWRRLHPERPSGWRSDGVLMALSPPGAIRAADRLTRKSLDGFSAIRVASVVVPSVEFCRLARLIYFDEHSAAETGAKQEIDRILESEGLGPLFRTPPVKEAGMEGYCPRCHGQVLRPSGDCPDCVGVAIEPFAYASPGAPAGRQIRTASTS
jgi:hypothetical protein